MARHLVDVAHLPVEIEGEIRFEGGDWESEDSPQPGGEFTML
jgi:hypothetical protein